MAGREIKTEKIEPLIQKTLVVEAKAVKAKEQEKEVEEVKNESKLDELAAFTEGVDD